MGWSCRKWETNNWHRADAQIVEGKWRRVRSKLRWEIALKVKYKELETAVRERSKQNVRRIKTQRKRNSQFYFLECMFIPHGIPDVVVSDNDYT